MKILSLAAGYKLPAHVLLKLIERHPSDMNILLFINYTSIQKQQQTSILFDYFVHYLKKKTFIMKCGVETFHKNFFLFYFIFKLYIIVLVLPNIKMNPPQAYMCSPS